MSIDADKISSAIKQCLAQDVEPFIESTIPSILWSYQSLHEKWKYLNPAFDIQDLKTALKSESDLSIFENGILRHPKQIIELNFDKLTEWLLERSVTANAECAVFELNELCENNYMDAHDAVYLNGIQPKSEFVFNEFLTLHPFRSIPAGSSTFLIPKYPQYKYTFDTRHLSNPMAALIIKYKIKPAIINHSEYSEYLTHSDFKDYEQKWQVLTEITHALTLIGPCCPCPIYIHHSYGLKLLEKAIGVVGFQLNELEPRCNSFGRYDIGEFDNKKASEIITAYMQLGQDFRNNLDIPISRLNQAIRRLYDPDRAIELGIALESLLTRDRDKDQTLSFLLRLRGAWLHGGNEKWTKFDVYKLLRQVYSMRSGAVHSGLIKQSENDGPRNKQLEQGIELCADLIIKIIKGKTWPNENVWEKMILDVT